jgi:hypothetical protein
MQLDDAHEQQLLSEVVGDNEEAATAAIDEIVGMVDTAMPADYDPGLEDERVERLALVLEVTARLGQEVEASLRPGGSEARSSALLRRLARWIAKVGPALKQLTPDEWSLTVDVGVVSVGLTWTKERSG